MSLCESCKKFESCGIRGLYTDGVRYECDDKGLVTLTELRRLRISQLRRMALSSEALTSGWRGILSNFPKVYQDPTSFRHRWLARHERFRTSCLAEIERLRALS